MNRKAVISEKVKIQLHRGSAPYGIQECQEAIQQELVDWVDLLNAQAPALDYENWIAKVFHRLNMQAKSRVWATVGQVREACEAQHKADAAARACHMSDRDTHENYDGLSFTVTQVRSGVDVGEDHFFGQRAIELQKRGISLETIERYRRDAYKKRAAFYGVANADKWLAERMGRPL